MQIVVVSVLEVVVSKVLFEVDLADRNWKRLHSFNYLICHFFKYLHDVFLESTNSRLSFRVVVDERLKNIRIQHKLIWLNSWSIDGSAEEMRLKNLSLLVISVTMQLDFLHSVNKRLWDVSFVVSWTDEENVWQIDGDIKKIVNKWLVLVRV